MKISSISSTQRGLATIIFVLVYPAFFALFVLAVESTRYLQEHARTGDVTEIAALAIAANASIANNDDKRLAKAFIDVYLPNSTTSLSSIDITRKSCSEIYGSNCGKPGIYDKSGLVFNEYKISIKPTFDSWFPKNDFAPGYNKTTTLQGTAVARKYQGFTVDVVFVADFSGSMYWYWNNERKYLGVINIINNITKDLEAFNKDTTQEYNDEPLLSRVAFVGFNAYTRMNGTYHSHLAYNYNPFPLWGGTLFGSFNYTNVNIEKTIQSPLNTIDTEFVGASTLYVDDIALTDDFEMFRETIQHAYPNGRTASYEGLLAGAKLAAAGKNNKKLIIVLSDGADSWIPLLSVGPLYIAKDLFNGGLCTSIIDSLESKTEYGKQVDASIVVITFDYDADENPGLKKCVGKDNLYEADSYQDIHDKISDLITEEVGHLYDKDYDPEK